MFNKAFEFKTNGFIFTNIKWFLGLFAFLLYSQTILFDYNMDDELVTKNHPKTSKGISTIKEIFTTPYYEDNMGYAYDYRPVVLASFAIEHQFFGESAATSHFFNVVIYAITCIVLFQLLTLLLGKDKFVLISISVLLFIIHPLHTEVVASIKNRDEILALLFAMLSFIYFVKVEKELEIKNLLIGVVFFILALLSKSSSVIFAFLIPFGILFFKEIKLIKILYISLINTIAIVLFFPYGLKVVYFEYYVFLLLVLPLVLHMLLNWKKIFLWLKNFYKNQILTFIPKNYELLVDKDIVLIEPTKNSFISELKEFIFESKEQMMNSNDFDFGYTVKEAYQNLFWMVLVVLGVIGLFGYVFLNEQILKFAITFFTLTVVFVKNINSNRIFVLLFMFFLALLLSYLGFNQYYLEVLVLFLTVYLLTFFNNSVLVIIAFFCFHGFFFLLSEFVLTNKIWGLNFIPLVVYLLIINMKFKAVKFLLVLILLVFSFNFVTEVLENLYLFFSEFKINKIQTQNLIFFFPALLILRKNRKFFFLTQSVILFFGLFTSNLINNIETITTQNKEEVSKPLVSLVDINISGRILKNEDREVSFVEKPLSYDDPISIKLGTSLMLMKKYLFIHVKPTPLLFYYGYSLIKPVDFFESEAILSLILHILLFLIALFCFIRDRGLSYFVFFYLICIMAVSSFVFIPAGMIGERFTYYSSVGFAVVLSILISKFIYLKKNKVSISYWVVFCLFLLISFYSYETIARTAKWKNELTLMSNDIKHLENSAVANSLFAKQLVILSFEQSNHKTDSLRQQALLYFENALTIYPAFFNVAFDIGRVNLLLNDNNAAKAGFEKAYAIDSNNVLVIEQLFGVYYQLDEFEKIEKFYLKLSKQRRLQEMDYYNLSEKFYNNQDYYKSMKVAVEGLQQYPNSQILIQLVNKNSLLQ